MTFKDFVVVFFILGLGLGLSDWLDTFDNRSKGASI